MDKIIEIKNLSKIFGTFIAVNKISFDVYKGQLFAFLGSNGAGKSTTINIICGILNKDGGEILIDNTSIDENSMNIKQKIGIVFQNSVLDKNLTVFENLRNKAMLYGLNNEEFLINLKNLVDSLDFSDYLLKIIKNLSGGQIRKVDIARALIHNPSILILDEPTTGLDPSTRKTVWQFLDKMKSNKNLTIFLTTHYMEEASDCDYIVILDKGKIVAQGTPNFLKEKHTNDTIKIYSIKNKKTIIDTLTSEGFNARNSNDCIVVEIDEILKAKKLIINHPDFFDDFELIKGKMDDVFINVTNKKLEGEQ